jgi:hypothetical protein
MHATNSRSYVPFSFFFLESLNGSRCRHRIRHRHVTSCFLSDHRACVALSLLAAGGQKCERTSDCVSFARKFWRISLKINATWKEFDAK